MSRPTESNQRPTLSIGLLFVALSFGLYWRSISFTFHFDDYVKIVLNPATKNIPLALKSFSNAESQSNNSTLSRHTYRPFFVMSCAILNKIFGETPQTYRCLNIFIHGLNAALVALLAKGLFALSPSIAIICGLAFLLHPTHAESVIWVVELSNIMAAFLILACVWIWDRARKMASPKAIWIIPLLFVLGLGFRETAILTPLVLGTLIFFFPLSKNHRNSVFVLLGMLLIVSFGYLTLRHHVVGRMSHISAEEFSWLTYGWSILIDFGMTVRYMILPWPSSINHRPWTMPTENPLVLVIGIVLLLCLFVFLSWMVLQKKNKWALPPLLLMLFWLPTSQIIPIRSIFSERFLYLLTIPFAWSLGLLFHKFGKIIKPLLACYLLGLALLTFLYIPAWKNDRTLWEHALKMEPRYWSNWVYLAEWEKASESIKGSEETKGWRERAEKNYIQALGCGLPTNEGARIFLRLAEINFQQEKYKDAEIHSQRALALNPNLKNESEALRRKYVN